MIYNLRANRRSSFFTVPVILALSLVSLVPAFSAIADDCAIEPLSCTVTVPGTANPWLAGAPVGTPTGDGDFAPAQSPVLLSCLPINGGDVLKFKATGSVSFCPFGFGCPISGPDGDVSVVQHVGGAQFNIADVSAPANSLVGVFLGPIAPTSPPPPLDFRSSRNFIRLQPLVGQVFFIGDGAGSLGTAGLRCQEFVVPCGATRLFLGVMDGFQWNNNSGSFAVTIHKSPTFDICLEDDSTGNRLQIDVSSGSYRFTDVASGSTLTGRGTVVISGCTIRLKDLIAPILSTSETIVDFTVFTCERRASGFIRLTSRGEPTNSGLPETREITRHITDSNTSDSSCAP